MRLAVVAAVIAFFVFIIIAITKKTPLQPGVVEEPLTLGQKITRFFHNVYYHPGDNTMGVGILLVLAVGAILGPFYLVKRFC